MLQSESMEQSENGQTLVGEIFSEVGFKMWEEMHFYLNVDLH